MRRIAAQAATTKGPLGGLLAGLHLGGPGFVGDDGASVPGSDVIAACNAISPSMVEREPEWAGWCGVLVNVNDLAAMGAAPVGLLNALDARDTSGARRVLAGLRDASAAYGVPVLGGHTQLGGARRARGDSAGPHLRAGAGRRRAAGPPGARHGGIWGLLAARAHRKAMGLHDLAQPDRSQALTGVVAAARPAAAKDVSMAGLLGTLGTLGMLAEVSGCGAVLDVAAVPRPAAEACLGGYLSSLTGPLDDRPPALQPGGPEIERLGALAGDMVVGAGYCELGDERSGGRPYNSAVCVTGDGVLGRHRKVHQPLGEAGSYAQATASAHSRRRSAGSG